jgi:hypothetical protein
MPSTAHLARCSTGLSSAGKEAGMRVQRGDVITVGSVAGLGLFLVLTAVLAIDWPRWVWVLVTPILAAAQGVAIGVGIRAAGLVALILALGGVGVLLVTVGRSLPLWPVVASQLAVSQCA